MQHMTGSDTWSAGFERFYTVISWDFIRGINQSNQSSFYKKNLKINLKDQKENLKRKNHKPDPAS